MLVGVNRVIGAVNEHGFEIYQRVAGDSAVRSRFDDALLDRGTEVLRDCAAENLVFKLEAAAARQGLEDDLAIAELAAPAGLFLMASLNFCALRDGLFVGNFRRMKRDLYAVTFPELVDHRLDVKLARAREEELFGLRVAVKVQRRVFFQNLVQRDADLLFVLAR